jgi:hypothetical protein
LQFGHLDVIVAFVERFPDLKTTFQTTRPTVLRLPDLFDTLDDHGMTGEKLAERIAILEYLVNTCQMDILATDGRGDTAMHYAASIDVDVMVRRIVELGGDMWVRNHDGALPLHAAHEGDRQGHWGVAAYLVRAMASALDTAGATDALRFAATEAATGGFVA